MTEKLQKLSDQFSQMSQKKQDLQTRICACESKMERVVKLITALSKIIFFKKKIINLKFFYVFE